MSIEIDRGESRDVRVDAFDRRVVRDALTKYSDDLEKSSKARAKLGLDTDDEDTRIAVIEGDGGFGIGLYTRFCEVGEAPEGKKADEYAGDQLGLGHEPAEEADEARAAREEQRTIVEAHCVEVRDGLLDEEVFPVGEYAEPLLVMVRRWTPEQRAEAMVWHERKESTPAPEHVLVALDRVRELLLSPDEVTRYSECGPWEIDSDVWEGTETLFWRAKCVGDSAVEGEPAPTSYDTATFESNEQALRRVAWLNKDDEARWTNEPQRETPTADAPPADADAPATGKKRRKEG